jgi:Uma2 family endonuclease
MKHTAISERLLTAEDLLALGDRDPCELIDGRILPMAPTSDEHGGIELAIGSELRTFVRRGNLGRVMVGEVGIIIRRDPDRVRGADVVFVSRRTSGGPVRGSFLETAPELVVEIVSPTDTWAGLRQKIDDYFSIGVERVWIVEPDRRIISVFRSPTESTRLGTEDTLRGEGALLGFEMPVRAVFEE